MSKFAYKVHSNNELVAGCRYSVDAAALAGIVSDGVVKWSGKIVWREGKEAFPASTAYDRAAQIIDHRIRMINVRAADKLVRGKHGDSSLPAVLIVEEAPGQFRITVGTDEQAARIAELLHARGYRETARIVSTASPELVGYETCGHISSAALITGISVNVVDHEQFMKGGTSSGIPRQAAS